MKIVEQLKQTGAFIRKTFIEVPEELSLNKGIKYLNVENITVKVTRNDGSVLLFDGDETSQNRMMKYYIIMKEKQILNIPWKLSDNSIIEVTADELLEALHLASSTQSSLWLQ